MNGRPPSVREGSGMSGADQGQAWGKPEERPFKAANLCSEIRGEGGHVPPGLWTEGVRPAAREIERRGRGLSVAQEIRKSEKLQRRADGAVAGHRQHVFGAFRLVDQGKARGKAMFRGDIG